MTTLGIINNDIAIDENTHDFKMVNNAEACAVVLKSAVSTVLGEIQLNTNLGVPYFDTAFVNPNKIPNWKMEVENVVRRFDFVRNILSFTYEFDSSTKYLNYKLLVLTIYGIVNVENMV